jgi:hypothetical protein
MTRSVAGRFMLALSVRLSSPLGRDGQEGREGRGIRALSCTLIARDAPNADESPGPIVGRQPFHAHDAA